MVGIIGLFLLGCCDNAMWLMKVSADHSSLHIGKTNKHYCLQYPSAKWVNKSRAEPSHQTTVKIRGKKLSWRTNLFYKIYKILDSQILMLISKYIIIFFKFSFIKFKF